eukprot:1143847-Pelagomonas_calceolata.AAC.8
MINPCCSCSCLCCCCADADADADTDAWSSFATAAAGLEGTEEPYSGMELHKRGSRKRREYAPMKECAFTT